MLMTPQINGDNVFTPSFPLINNINEDTAAVWRKILLENLNTDTLDSGTDTGIGSSADSNFRIFNPSTLQTIIEKDVTTEIDTATQKGAITATEATTLKDLINRQQFQDGTFIALMDKIGGLNPGPFHI